MSTEIATRSGAIRKLLLRDTAVNSDVNGRVYINQAPQKKRLPFLIVTGIDASHEHHMEGASGYAIGTVQVDGYSKDLTQMQSLADNVRLALDGRSKETVSVGAESITLKYIHLDGDNTSAIPPSDASGRGIHRFSHDYGMGHTEAVGTFT